MRNPVITTKMKKCECKNTKATCKEFREACFLMDKLADQKTEFHPRVQGDFCWMLSVDK